MFKKILGTCLCMTIILSQALCVMAAPTYVTETKYEADNKIEVTTTINGATKGDQLTYLAYKPVGEETEPTSGNIVYIDQHEITEAETTTYTFSYKTDSTDIGATVKFGGASEAGADIGVTDSSIPGVTYTINLSGGVNETDKKVVASAEGSFTKIACIIGEGKVLTGVSKKVSETTTELATNKWYSSADGFWISNDELAEGATYTLTVTETEADPTVTKLGHETFDKMSDQTTAGSRLCVVGRVEGLCSEYGIIISNTAITTTEGLAPTEVGADGTTIDFSSLSGTYKFKALGKGSNGQFMVSLEDGGTDTFAGVTNIYVYCMKSDNSYVLNEIAQAADAAPYAQAADVSIMSVSDNTPVDVDLESDVIIVEDGAITELPFFEEIIPEDVTAPEVPVEDEIVDIEVPEVSVEDEVVDIEVPEIAVEDEVIDIEING